MVAGFSDGCLAISQSDKIMLEDSGAHLSTTQTITKYTSRIRECACALRALLKQGSFGEGLIRTWQKERPVFDAFGLSNFFEMIRSEIRKRSPRQNEMGCHVPGPGVRFCRAVVQIVSKAQIRQ